MGTGRHGELPKDLARARSQFQAWRMRRTGHRIPQHLWALAVVHQHLQRRPSAIAKDEDGAGERVFVKGLLAESRQAVDAATEVGRLDGHQDLHLRCDLQHDSAFQKLRARVATSAAS